MNGLKSELIIENSSVDPSLYCLKTGCRVFDFRSLLATYKAVQSGCFGCYSRRSFYLSGSVQTSEGSVDFKYAFLMKFGKNWGLNPRIILLVKTYGPVKSTVPMPKLLEWLPRA